MIEFFVLNFHQKGSPKGTKFSIDYLAMGDIAAKPPNSVQ